MKKILFFVFCFVVVFVLSCKLEVVSNVESEKPIVEESVKIVVDQMLHPGRIIVFTYKTQEYIVFYNGNNSCMVKAESGGIGK
jgi:hypothetical protein